MFSMPDLLLDKLVLQLPLPEAAGRPELLWSYALVNNAVHNTSSCGIGVVEPVTFGNYLPRAYGGNNDLFSEWLLRVKNGKYPEFGNASDLLAPFINHDTIIITVPSSTAGKRNGIQRVAENLHTRHGIHYAEGSLIRHTSIEASHRGGERSVKVHSDSIRVDSTQLGGNRPILLLDDIFTSGCSMRACEFLLRDAGVENMTFAAIGRTRHMDQFGNLEPLRSVDWYDLIED